MVFRYCLGMIMSVSTLMIFSGAATPSSVVNLSIGRTSWLELTKPSCQVVYRECRERQRAKSLESKIPGIMVSGWINRTIHSSLANRHLPRLSPCRRRKGQNDGRSRGSAHDG